MEAICSPAAHSVPEPGTEPALSFSLGAIISLTGWSERTVWRRLAAGSIVRVDRSRGGSKVWVCWHSARPHALLTLDQESLALLCRADAGEIEAQSDIALVFLQHGIQAGATHWLQQAARGGDADAMHWLGRSYLSGADSSQDRNMGLMWLARSACAGHLISDALLAALCAQFGDTQASTRRS